MMKMISPFRLYIIPFTITPKGPLPRRDHYQELAVMLREHFVLLGYAKIDKYMHFGSFKLNKQERGNIVISGKHFCAKQSRTAIYWL